MSSDSNGMVNWILSCLSKNDVQKRCCKALLNVYALHTARKILNRQRDWTYVDGKDVYQIDIEWVLHEFFKECYENLDEAKIFKDWLLVIKDWNPSPSSLDLLELMDEEERYGSVWQLAVRELTKEILEYLVDE